MTAHGFTAGPWMLSKRDDPEAPYSIISGAESGRAIAIAMCPRYRGDDWTADARLIAAAPDLLAGLLHMRACASCAEGDWEDCEGGRAANEAIAAATGSRG